MFRPVNPVNGLKIRGLFHKICIYTYCTGRDICLILRSKIRRPHRLQEDTEDDENHRRRIYKEAKAKVIVTVWGAEFIKFLAALAILVQSIWKKKNSTSK